MVFREDKYLSFAKTPKPFHMKTIIIFIVELFFIFGGISIFVLGQSLPTLLKRKQPFKHYFLMLSSIFKIETRKACGRLLIPFLFGFAIFLLSIPVAPPLGNDFMSVYGPKQIVILGLINLILLSIPVIAILICVIKKKEEKTWQAIRIRAHHSVYGEYPKYGEYGTAFESLWK